MADQNLAAPPAWVHGIVQAPTEQAQKFTADPGDVAGERRRLSHGGDAVNWLWLNISLMAVFFTAMTGVPLWLVFKHPDCLPAFEPRQVRPGWAVAPPPIEPDRILVASQHAEDQITDPDTRQLALKGVQQSAADALATV